MHERTVAILPMRHSSERVKGKNYRLFGGVPLYHHITRTLLDVDGIDEVVIDTDSEVISQDCATHFPQVRVIERPVHLRAGEIPMNDVLLNSLSQLEADVVIQTHSTNPFLTAATISDAIRAFHNREDETDSMFSVSRLQARLWDSDSKPVNHDPSVLMRTQDLPALFIENSSFFIFTPDLLITTGARIGSSPKLIEMSSLESLDIDTEDDFALASAIYASKTVAS